ncbi:MAG: ABC transporter ATP-binding protein [Arenicellales bacterium WSBS_2016_MAG_OTU3]
MNVVSKVLLETKGLTKSFGGNIAVNNIDFSLPEGKIRAVIGPNGAGKTTLVSLICGRIFPTTGNIYYQANDITTWPSHVRARRGIVYTFQVTSIYKNLSCFDNVAVAVQRTADKTTRRSIADKVEHALASVSLANEANKLASELPYGHQRLLEVAMTLALTPSILILDEPTQGLAQGEIEELEKLIRSISANTTVLLIEHNMPFVLRLAECISVMNHGTLIAQGTAAEISNNAQVQQVYLGGNPSSHPGA